MEGSNWLSWLLCCHGNQSKVYKCLYNISLTSQYYVIHDMSQFWCSAGSTRDVQETLETQVKFTMPAIPPSLTSSRGEYLRVVGIHSNG